MGVRVPLYLKHSKKDGAHPSPFAALFFTNSKSISIEYKIGKKNIESL